MTGPHTTGQPLWHGRFGEGPADELLAFTVSLPFDRRLATDDLAGSRAHVSMLAHVGLLTDEERSVIHAALDRVEAGAATKARSRSPRPTRTSTPRSSAASPRSRAVPAPSCTPGAAATTRSRSISGSTCGARAATRSRRIHALQQVLLRRANDTDRSRAPGLHPPAAGPAGPARAPPARALLGAGTRCRPLARLPRARRRVAARRGRARRVEPAARPDLRRRRARLPTPVPELARRGAPTATSSPKRCSSRR